MKCRNHFFYVRNLYRTLPKLIRQPEMNKMELRNKFYTLNKVPIFLNKNKIILIIVKY